MRKYEISYALNGYVVEQKHTLEQGNDTTIFGTQWVFLNFEEAVEFIAVKFGKTDE